MSIYRLSLFFCGGFRGGGVKEGMVFEEQLCN